jgi:hypothetical protein
MTRDGRGAFRGAKLPACGTYSRAAGNHQDRHFCSPFAISDDHGLVAFPVSAEDDEEFGFATRSGDHLSGPLSRREAGFGELAFDQP